MKESEQVCKEEIGSKVKNGKAKEKEADGRLIVFWECKIVLSSVACLHLPSPSSQHHSLTCSRTNAFALHTF